MIYQKQGDNQYNPYNPEAKADFSQNALRELFRQKNFSNLTVKNYTADISHLITWYEKEFEKKFSPLGITPQILDLFKKYLGDKGKSTKTINRHFSSIRSFFDILKKQGIVAKNPAEPFDSAQGKQDPGKLKQFKDFLYVYGSSDLTIKNYLLDVQHFLEWAAKSGFDLDKYKNSLLTSGLAPASIKRKLSSVRKYLVWAKQEGIITDVIHPRGEITPVPHPGGGLVQPVTPETGAFGEILEPEKSNDLKARILHFLEAPKRVFGKSVDFLDYLFEIIFVAPAARFFPRLGLHPRFISGKQAALGNKFRLNRKTVLGVAAGLILLLGIGFVTSKILFKKPAPTVSVNQGKARTYLFSGKLSDSRGKPITKPVSVDFNIYPSQSSDLALWQDKIKVSPETNGDFSILLGENSPLYTSLFVENETIWLGIKIEGNPELKPRYQIPNADLSRNSYYLREKEPGVEARANMIPVLDSQGNLNLAARSPEVVSTDGEFTVLGESLTLKTIKGDLTLSPKDGNIILSPEGNNGIDIRKKIYSSTGDVEVNDELSILSDASSSASLTVEQDGLGDLAVFKIASISAFLIKNTGFVGIGTETPKRLLDIAGDFGLDGNIYYDGSALSFFNKDATETARLTSDGKFALGTTSPTSLLHVKGNVSGKPLVTFDQTGTEDILTASASGTTKLSLTKGGRLGIAGELDNITGSTLTTIDSFEVQGTTLTLGNGSDSTIKTVDKKLTIDTGSSNTITFGTDDDLVPGSGTADLGSTSSRWSNLYAAAVNVSGDTTLTGDLAVNGGDITTTATTFNLLNTIATTVNFAGAGTVVSIGATTGTTTVNNALTVTGATTLSSTLGVTGATTLSSTLGVTGDTTLTGDLAVNGGDITSTSATFNLLNQPTTLNIGSTAVTRTINIGTGTNADTINIGTGGTGSDVITIGGGVGTVAIDSGDWDISTTGALTGISGITNDGSYTQSGTSTNTFSGATTFSASGTALTVDNNALISGNLTANGNTTLGDTAADTVTFTAVVASNIVSDGGTRNLGSSAVRWATVYGTNGDFTNVAGVVTTGSTSAATWTVNSDNATNNAEVAALAFETGTATFNAVEQWNASSDAGKVSGYDDNFLFNYPISIFSQVSGGSQTFTSGSLFNYGQNATHAITQTGAFVGLDTDFSSNITVPNSSSGNQTGVLITLKDGGASATATGISIAGTADYAFVSASTAGNVGIGDTTPDDLLNILSTSAAAGIAITSTGTDTDAYLKFELTDGTANFTMGVDDSDSDKFKISTTALGTSDRFVIDASGNVGINSASPGVELLVADSGDAGDDTAIRVSNISGAFAQMQWLSGAGTTWTIGTQDNFTSNALLFRAGSTDLVTLSTTGTVTLAGTSGAGDLTINSGETSFTSPITNLTANQITANSLTSGIALGLGSTSTSFGSGKMLSITKGGASGSSAFTGDIINAAYSQTFNAGVGLNSTGNVFDISRSITLNNSGNTHTISGAVATIADTMTQTAGTLTSTADVLDLTQNYASNSGAALNVTTAGTGLVARFNDDGTLTDSTATVIDNTGNVGIGLTNPGSTLDVKSTASSAFTVGANGSTNPVLQIDASTGSQAAGLKLTGATSAGTVALAVISSGSNANLTIDALGSGTISIGATSTGDVLLAGGNSATGCTVTNSTGALACSGNITTSGTGTAIQAGFWTRNTTSGYLYNTTQTDNVGIGTTAPSQTLHVVGQCVTGDSILITENGRQIRIDEVRPGMKVYTLNQETGKLVPAQINALLDMGVKPVFKLTTKSGKEIRTTGNHPYLVRGTPLFVTGSKTGINQSKNYQSYNKDNQVHNNNGVVQIQNIHLFSNRLTVQKEAVITPPHNTLSNSNLSSTPGNATEASATSATSENISDNLSNLPSENLNNAINNNASTDLSSGQWTKVMYLKPGMEIAVAGNAEKAAWDEIVSIEYTGEEQVWDIEVEGTHNFVANGIIAHNTYVNSAATTGIALDIDANSLTSGSGLDISSTSTAAASNTQKGLNIALSGTNGTSAQTTYGAYISNIHAGTTSTNVGLYATATSGTSANYAAIFEAGNVGIGTTNPGSALDVKSTAASAFTVGANGSSNPAFQIDASTASQVAGLKLTGAATGGTVALAAIDSGSNTSLTIDAKGSGTVSIGATSTGDVLLAGGNSSTGCTVTNSTGAFACTAGTSATTGLYTNFLGVNKATAASYSLDVGSNNLSARGINIDQNGAKTAADYGSYIANTSTSSTASVNKYGEYITSTGTWNGTSAVNYGLYVDTPSGGTTNYGAVFAGGNVGIGTTAPGALLDVDMPDASSITAEKINIRSANTAQTLTDGTTIANWRANQFIAPTLNGVAAGGTETVTSAATLYIDAAPSGSNITISNPYALWVDAGNTKLDGFLFVGGNATTQTDRIIFAYNDFNGTSANEYGMVVQPAHVTNTTTGTLYGLYVNNIPFTGGITVAQNEGIHIANPTGTATVTTNYGINIDNQTRGTSDYGVYIAGADTYALWVDSGTARFDGVIDAQSDISDSSGNLTLNDAVDISGTLTLTGAETQLIITNTSGNAAMQFNGTGASANSYIDLAVAGGNADYDFRILRGTGANGNTTLDNRGTGQVGFTQNLTERLALQNTGAVFNEGSNDYDFRIESDGNTNAFVIDGGTNTMGLLGGVSTEASLRIDPAAQTVSSGSVYERIFAAANGAITVDTVTLTTLATMKLVEPNITIGTGAVTNAVTLYIQMAPTEGTNNYALWVDSGATQLDGTLAVVSDTTFTGDLAVNGGDLTSSATTFNLLNATVTTLNIGGAATSVAIGAASAQFGFSGGVASDAKYTLQGTYTGGTNAFGIYLPLTITVPAGGQGSILRMGGATLVEAASGNHSTLIGFQLLAPTVTAGVATVTNTATLYVDGAMSATVSGANYAIWSDAGTNRFDADTYLAAASGNVGIGTTGPDAPLSFANALGNKIEFYDSESYGIGIQSNLLQIYGDNSSSDVAIGHGNNSGSSGFVQVMRITGAGNVGIGTDTTPDFKFSVQDGLAALQDSSTDSGGYWWHFDGGNYAYQDFQETGVAATQRLRMVFNVATGGENTRFAFYGDGTAKTNGGNWTNGGAGDYAEYFETRDTSIDKGDVVMTDNLMIRAVSKSSTPYAGEILGIVSTKPGFIGNATPVTDPEQEKTFQSIGEGPNRKIIALAGQVPVKVTIQNGGIVIGDSITSSPLSAFGMKATKAGTIVAKAIEGTENWNETTCQNVDSVESIIWPEDQGQNETKPCFKLPDGNFVGKIMAFVNVSWHDPDVYITSTGDLSIVSSIENQTATNSSILNTKYLIQNTAGQVVQRVGAFAEVAVANLRAGAIDAQEIVAERILLGRQGVSLTSQGIISPLAEVDEIHTNVISPLATDTVTVDGNLEVTKQLTADNVTANEATISGTLRAGKIVADEIEGLEARLSTVSANYITNVTNVYQEASASASPSISEPASPSTSLSDFPTFPNGLMSFGPASFYDVSIAGNFYLGANFIMSSTGIDVLGADLSFQGLRQGGISFVGNLITFDKDGNVKVAGTLSAGIISPLPDQDLVIKLASQGETLQTSLVVKNASDSAVLAINQQGDLTASGSATFKKLNIFSFPVLALSDTEVEASSSAGQATVKAGKNELTIKNSYVTDKSLIYITPVATGSAQPENIYLIRQVPGESFTVGTNGLSLIDRLFNWLIIN